MQQLLHSYDIPARIVDRGLPHFGCGTSMALQVHPQDRWTALLLLSPVEDGEALNPQPEPGSPQSDGSGAF